MTMYMTRIEDLHGQNRAERRRLFFHSRKTGVPQKQHNRLFAGESWADVNVKVEKMAPYVNPKPKVLKFNHKKRPRRYV
jgi:formylmethanofuran dehydrogenase subunit A